MGSTTEGDSPTLRTAVLPLTGSLLLTYGVACLLCRLPAAHSLSWPVLIALATLYESLAVGVYAAALYGVGKAFGEFIEISSETLIHGSWIGAAWMPLFVLLLREDSSWSACLPPLMVAPAVLLLRRRGTLEPVIEEGSAQAPEVSPIFRINEEPLFLSMLLPAVMAALSLELGIAALLAGYDAAAGGLFAACAAVVAWRWTGRPAKKPREDEPAQVGRRRLLLPIGRALVVLLCTACALLPFLKHPGGRFLRAQARQRLAAAAKPLPVHAGSAYSGVVLFLPPLPKKPIVAPSAAKTVDFGHRLAKPIVIPFDGTYWYFQPPDDRPEPDAPVIRGDPTKANAHARDRLPLLMEAHQSLGSSVKMDCCRAMHVIVLNADHRLGKVSLEVVLRNTRTKTTSTLKLSGSTLFRENEVRTSLGTVLVPSSAMASLDGDPVRTDSSLEDRKPVEETLSFPFPPHASMKEFDEITVVFLPSQERALVGAQIAIHQFVLEP